MSFKKIWLLIGGVLLLLILLNPGINRFKEYIGLNSKSSKNIKRNNNFLIFSIYEESQNNKKYIGILFNFIEINKKSVNIPDSSYVISAPTNDSLIIGSIYHTNDGRTYTKNQLIQNGYSEERIRKGVYNGVLIPVLELELSNDKKMKLWAGMCGDMMFDKSYEEFKKKYSSKDSIDFLYNGLSDDKLYTKSRNDFYNQYFSDVKSNFNKTVNSVNDSLTRVSTNK